MAAGGIIGGALGGVAGAASLLIMRLSGTDMEEIRYWQYKWRHERSEQVQEAMKVSFFNLLAVKVSFYFHVFCILKLFKIAAEASQPTPEIIKDHDEKIGKDKISLDQIK